MRCTRSLLTLLALLATGAAWAQCSRGPTTSELSIKGFGAAYFEQVRTDTAHDRVEFYGGVCLTGEGAAWTILAQRLTIQGLSGELAVSAQQATLEAEGWHLEALSLHATRQRIEMSAVRMRGKQLSGTATSVTMQLANRTLVLERVDLRGALFYVRGRRATLTTGGATVEGPVITSCNCAGAPLYDVAGSSAQVDPSGQRLALVGGKLKVGAVTIPLSEHVTIDQKTLQELTPPLKIEYVPSDAAAGVTGTGLGLTIGPVGLAPHVSAEVGAVGLDPQYPLSAVALLRGSQGGDAFMLGKAPGGMRFEVTTDHALSSWLDAGFDVRVLEPGNRDELREGVLHARAHAPLRAVNGAVALRTFAAASAQTPSSATIAGARLGAAVSGTAGTPPAPWGQVTLRFGASSTVYPDQGARQWGVELQPAYALNLGPLALKASYLARLTNSGSPFTTTLDKLEPLERPALDVSVDGPLAPGWRASAGLQASYDLVGSSDVTAGLNLLNVRASVSRQVGGWRLDGGAGAVLAGILAPDGVRDGYLHAELSARDGDLELGARARYRFQPTATGLELLQLDAAVPIALPGVDVRPYLALNFAPTVSSGALPAIVGHGLDLTFVTCCGALTLGYRDVDGTWRVSASVDLHRRTTPASQASGCSSGAASSTLAPAAGELPGTCTVAAGGAGIMTGAAPGAPP